MNIILIAHNLSSAGGLSVGRNIVSTLPEVAPMHTYLMIVPKGCGYPDFNEADNVNVIECPQMHLSTRWWWEKTVMCPAIDEFKPEWIWALGNIGLSKPICPQSVLFHIPHFLYSNRHYGYTNLELIKKRFSILPLQRFLIERGFKNSHRVYCQTTTAKNRLASKFGIPLEKIGICPNAVSFSLQKSNRLPKELEKFHNHFILFVLTKYYSHKNLERIVDLFEQYQLSLKDVVCIMPVRPEQGKRAAKLVERIEKAGLEKHIVCLDSIPQEQLGDFFNAVDLMFLPTLLESFSGTYLEAMYLDTPILTSDMDFAREICGSAAEYIDPFSLKSMYDGILRLRKDRTRREMLVQLGRQQLKHYTRSWSDILRNVLDQEGINHT